MAHAAGFKHSGPSFATLFTAEELPERLDLLALFGAEGLYAYRVLGKGLPAHQIAKGDILVLSRPGNRWRRIADGGVQVVLPECH